MNAVDEIETAIKKLTEMWVERGYFEANGWLGEYIDGASGTPDDPESQAVTNDELFVTLHRTIDAQLAILRDFTERYKGQRDDWLPIAPAAYNALMLARAINGTST